MAARLKINICAVFFGLVLYWFYKASKQLDFQLNITSFPDTNNCQYHYERHIGPEDITKVTEDIIVSMSNDNIAMWEFQEGLKNTPPGYIWFYYMDKDVSVKPEIQNKPQNFVFQPHGIYYENKSQDLFVLNHPYQGKGDRIEQFHLDLTDLENIQVTYLRSLQLPTYLNGVANDLIKITDNEFLVTQWISKEDDLNDSSRDNFYGKFRKLLMVFNNLFNRRQTQVHSCLLNSNNQFECVQTEARGNIINGITWNQKDTVLVADSSHGAKNVIHEYKLKMSEDRQNRLEFVQYIYTTGHPDNVEYDIFLDQYYTGGMIKIYQYFIYTHAQKARHPDLDYEVKDFWQFMDIIKYEDGKYKVENVLARDDIYRGCSIGTFYKNKLILGSFTDKSITVCNYKGVNDKLPYMDGIIPFYKKLLGF